MLIFYFYSFEQFIASKYMYAKSAEAMVPTIVLQGSWFVLIRNNSIISNV